MSQSHTPFDSIEETFLKPMEDMQAAMMRMAQAGTMPMPASPLMVHPTAAVAAATALSLGAFAHMAGLVLGSLQGAAEASRRLGMPFEPADSDAAVRSFDSDRAGAEKVGTDAAPADAAMRRIRVVAAKEVAARAGSRAAAAADKASPVRRRRRAEAAVKPPMVEPKAMARPETPADLKQIAGIGPKLEEVLNGLGIWTFGQIAEWSAAETAWVEDHLQFSGRIGRDDWIGQAKALVKK